MYGEFINSGVSSQHMNSYYCNNSISSYLCQNQIMVVWRKDPLFTKIQSL